MLARWWSPPNALLLLRLAVAGVFLSHATVRLANGTIGRFADYLGGKGMPWPLAEVWAITAFELIGGALLALGRFKRPLAVAFIAMLGMGIVLIHAEQGWWVGEHGSGGCEYSVVLMFALLAVGAEPR